MSSAFRYAEKREPGNPGHTCPDIDRIISMLNDLRADNDQLRQNADYWKSQCYDAYEEMEKENERADTLEAQLNEAISNV